MKLVIWESRNQVLLSVFFNTGEMIVQVHKGKTSPVFLLNTHTSGTSVTKCIGFFFPDAKQFLNSLWTPAGSATIQFSSDTTYLELTSDLTG